MLNGFDYVLAALAALAAGAVNAIAGGGTLITFPMLTFLGVPAVTANVTNTVALCPGYFGGTIAQWNDLKTQRRRLWLVIPASVVGGILGGFLLLQTGERLFRELVPYLILLASGLLAIQDPVRAWLTRRIGEHHGARLEKVSWLPVGLASVYGGYFGAGLSVIVLSALGLTMEDTLTRLNALKQAVAFSVNVAAAIFFICPQGMILVTGPTGSGKTSTLYAALNFLAAETTNIVTIEHPVEYRLAGINQVAVSDRAGLTFATGLRSILRQDPNVVMVGEMRDLEAAQVAFQAAQTGHLVLSTLHTNDAPSAVTRLVDMGIPAYLVASSVIAVQAQRLVRRLCQGKRVLEDARAEPGGCEACRFTGYRGRMAVHELLRLTPRVRTALLPAPES